jgi:hypothetical protein
MSAKEIPVIDIETIKARLDRTLSELYEAADNGDSVSLSLAEVEVMADDVRALVAEVERLRKPPAVRSLDEWHEDHGTVLWWTLPICEPPYVGAPLDSDWPGYHTHWTAIAVPNRDGEP